MGLNNVEADEGSQPGQRDSDKGHRRKKPRAKTKQMKLHECESPTNEGNKCDKARQSGQAVPEVRWIASGGQSLLRGANIYNNPLISISMVAASSERSPTSCVSSLWSLRSQLAIEQAEESGREVGADHDSASMQPLNRNNSAQFSGESLSPLKNRLGGREDLDSVGSGASLSGLDAVKSSYSKLINYNKLQCFYLGALLYSLSSLTFVLNSIVGDHEETRTSSINETNSSSKAFEAPPCGRLSMNSAWQLASIELPLTLLLLVIVVIKLTRFSLGESDPASRQYEQVTGEERTQDPTSARYVPGVVALLGNLEPCIGATISVALLILPTSFIYLQGFGEHCAPAPILPTLLLATLVYVLPVALSEIRSPKTKRFRDHRLNTRAICSCLACGALILPTVWIISTKYQQFSVRVTQTPERISVSQARLVLLLVGVALVCGQLRRRLLVRLASEMIFRGASELIEAKVSLEQQRQQQETLLLSVLPAYVAEQVKRNMVKKMESLDEQQLVGPLESCTPNHYHQMLVGTSNASTQTFGSPQVRSLTLPAVEDPPEMATSKGLKLSVARARQRNSFVTFSRLSSSLASGAAFLSESLLNRGSQKTEAKSLDEHQNVSTGTQVYVSASGANSTNHLTSLHHVPSQSSGLAPIASLPTSGFSLQQQQSRRGFNELYIRTYNNVSLLYGDIVGFTSLCTQLSSSQLVRVLNNLFSYFDHLADQHKIMRIKILGDCYYGVSGIPEFAVMGAKSGAGSPKSKKSNRQPNSHHNHQHPSDNHAINCVNMGLDMIKYIKCLNIDREQRRHSNSSSECQLAALMGTANGGRGGGSGAREQHRNPCSRQQSAASSDNPQLPAHFELNMRIGIHTGHIHSGVIGLKKWQFDVWSNDVSIAMHCESSGVAGRVQVTEATVQHLNEAFTFEPAPSTSGPQNLRDSFLVDKDIRTYLIKERVEPAASSANKLNVNLDTLDRKRNAPTASAHNAESGATMDEEKIRAATIGTISQTLLSAEMPGTSSTSALALALEHNDLKWLSLRLRDAHQEQQYLDHPLSLARLMREVFQLLILIATLWLADRSLLSSYETANTTIFFGVVSLLLVVLGARLVKESKAVASNGSGSRRDTIDRAPVSLTHLEELAQTSPEVGGKNQKFAWAIQWRRSLCDNRLAVYLRSRFQRRETPLKEAQSGLSHYLSLLTFASLMVGQLYLIENEMCRQSSGVSPSVATLYQITAFLLLVALDLSAVLISYQLKSILILLIALLQLALLISPIQSQAAPLCGLMGGLNSTGKLQLAPQMAFQARNQNHLILWLNDLLLLILALWSLAYARKLHYSNRCDFLWRNRLNVDHEELEYISGINKVLLENILPSHVVQHYLSTANSHQAAPAASISSRRQPLEMTTVAISCDGAAPDGHRLRHQVSERRHSHRKLVRMSIGNMHRYLSHEHELYNEQHDSVAVMFASIPHFYEFYDESDISKQGLGCIALLNEIICDFDKLLLKNKFSRIEKIKTIGSTYMAAAGLRPNPIQAPASARTSTSSSQVNFRPPTTTSQAELSGCQLSAADQAAKMAAASQQTKMNLICMIQFASSLMSALNGINKQSFQVFKLRVGVNTGPVIAGIIGAQRPFYDIWGDCVNIASRMESLGEIGRIQVEERTAKLLLECLCTESYQIEKRGHIDVKGKGGMVTYFVDKRQPAQHLHHQSSLQQPVSGGEPARNALTLASSHESLDRPHEQRHADRGRQVAAAATSTRNPRASNTNERLRVAPNDRHLGDHHDQSAVA